MESNYKVRISKKCRRMQIRIDQAGSVEVVVPNRLAIPSVQRFVNSKQDWIQRALENTRVRKPVYKLAPDGYVRLLGEDKRIVFTLSAQRRFEIYESDLFLSRRLFPTESEFNLLLKQFAQQYLNERVGFWGKKMGLRVNKVTLRNQRSRWGSCSRQGNISLNIKLIHFASDVIDYVIVHELCHLQHMNHSKSFWRKVEQYLPNFRELKKVIRESI